MTDIQCGGMIPIKLNSSTNQVSIPCPSRDDCLRFTEEVRQPVALYYDMINKSCKSFIGKN